MAGNIASYCKDDPSLPSQRKKFSARGRNSLSEEEIYRPKKRFLDRGRNLLAEQSNSFLEVEISCQRKKILVRERKFLSEEEISC